MKFYNAFLFVFVNYVVVSVTSNVCSGKKSSIINGKEYKLFQTFKRYNDAKKSCQLWGKKMGSKSSGLAKVSDVQTQACLTEMITSKRYLKVWNRVNAFTRGYYLGGSDNNAEGEWKWDNSDHVPLRKQNGFQNWGRFEPNDYKKEDCMMMLFKGIDGLLFRDYKPGKWVDVACKYRRFYICERELPVPDRPVTPKRATQPRWAPANVDWGYFCPRRTPLLTPERWQERYPSCAGSRQSPIHINFQKVMQCDSNGFSNTVAWGNVTKNVKWIVRNSGNGIEMRTQPAKAIYTSFEGGKRKLFVDSMRLTWGQRRGEGSEHRIGEHFMDGELQVFHVAEKGEERHALAFMLQERDSIDNANWHELIRQINRVQLPNLEEDMASPLDHVAQFLGDTAPSHIHHGVRFITDKSVRYSGSLPHPPCTEDVLWTVYPQPITLSTAQFSTLRRVKGFGGRSLSGHVRPLQPFNGELCAVI